MDLRKVKKLIELVEESGISELEVRNGDESIRIAMASQPVVVSQTVPSPPAASTIRSASEDSGTAVGQGAGQITAPMAGTFYRAPSPEAEPYVATGQKVSAGEIVCIIESMKMMHEIRAGVDGVVGKIVPENGTPVGSGDVLFVLK